MVSHSIHMQRYINVKNVKTIVPWFHIHITSEMIFRLDVSF